MAKLTDGNGGTIAKATPPATGQRLVFDEHRDAPRGFGLRITQAGGKAFILKYAFDGRQRRLTIGQWPTWSVNAARDHASELARQIDQGIDPLEQKSRRRSDPTVDEAVDDYLKRYVSGLSSAKPVGRYFTRDLVPVLGNKKLSDVTKRDLIDLIENKATETPTAARRLLAYLKAFFDWCADRDLIHLSPAASIKPKTITVPGKKNVLKAVKRERVLSDDEIVGFWHAQTDMHRLTALALKLVLVTGQRPGEVAGMHESELQQNVWTIPANRRGKTDSEHVVGLPPLAMEIIAQAQAEVERLSKRRGHQAGFIFEVRAGHPLDVNALSKAVKRHRAELGNQDDPKWGHWTPHDLRRTCRTRLGACGVTDEVGERVVGHVSEAMIQTYNKHGYIDEKRRALAKWQSKLQRLVGEQAGNNVVELAG